MFMSRACNDWMQGADRPWPDRQWALCIFDDLLEHAGPVCCASFCSMPAAGDFYVLQYCDMI